MTVYVMANYCTQNYMTVMAKICTLCCHFDSTVCVRVMGLFVFKMYIKKKTTQLMYLQCFCNLLNTFFLVLMFMICTMRDNF